MYKDLDDLTVGDFSGLSVDMIRTILSKCQSRRPYNDAELMRRAEEAAQRLFKTKDQTL